MKACLFVRPFVNRVFILAAIIVGPNMRATASAIALFINNLVGIGLGNLLIGILSDFLSKQFAEEALRYSIAFGVIFYLIAAALFLHAAKYLESDWQN